MLELRQEHTIARLLIRRPGKKNAMTEDMWRSLLDHCEGLRRACESAAPDAPRVLVLQGEGGAFCAGADIGEMQQLVRSATRMADNNRVVEAAQLALERLPMPTLAAIDGPCFGGGMGLASACDFRVASARSTFAVTPSGLGILYSLPDSRRLVRLVGDANARRLLLRGERIDARTAQHWGLLTDCCEPGELDDRADALARQLAAQSRTSMAGIKAVLAHLGGDPQAPDEAALRALFTAAFQGPDFAEGAAAFVDRREPRFR